MANQTGGAEMMNGHLDFPQKNLSNKNESEMLEQIKQLLVENNKLKETMKQKNQEMKERLEELLKRERQREEQGLVESGLTEAKERLFQLGKENEMLRREIQYLKEGSNTQGEDEMLKQMKAQIVRLQAEKADLLGIISELQVKLSSCASEDSFVEINIAGREAGAESNDSNADHGMSNQEIISCRTKSLEDHCGLESEELAVRKLLHSLREETEKVEQLQRELAVVSKKLSDLEQKSSYYVHKETETDLPVQENDGERQTAELLSVEVEALKEKAEVLNKELYETNEKLSQAQQIKNKLEDRCSSLDKKLADSQVNVDDRQTLLYSVQTLELQVESLKSEIKLEQKKNEEQKKLTTTLQEALDKQKCDFELLRKAEAEKVPKVQLTHLSQKLEVCEQALAKKQQEIDGLKDLISKHQEDEDTIAVLKAQIDVYCSDFHAEREARQNVHHEKEELATQLAYFLQENEKLKDEIHGRHSIEQLQRRHASQSSEGSEGPHLTPRGAGNLEALGLNVHICPKCQLSVPDIDTLQIHVMECIT
ncbi:optineurin [Hyperolius riggenbachi]|uniref:optineurin n=1 Tax=Hyperolius riggenbachi TaxID=752182 RepID=UPI0035A2E19B